MLLSCFSIGGYSLFAFVVCSTGAAKHRCAAREKCGEAEAASIFIFLSLFWPLGLSGRFVRRRVIVCATILTRGTRVFHGIDLLLEFSEAAVPPFFGRHWLAVHFSTTLERLDLGCKYSARVLGWDAPRAHRWRGYWDIRWRHGWWGCQEKARTEVLERLGSKKKRRREMAEKAVFGDFSSFLFRVIVWFRLAEGGFGYRWRLFLCCGH